MEQNKSNIAILLGDPAGIGPELISSILSSLKVIIDKIHFRALIYEDRYCIVSYIKKPQVFKPVVFVARRRIELLLQR